MLRLSSGHLLLLLSLVVSKITASLNRLNESTSRGSPPLEENLYEYDSDNDAFEQNYEDAIESSSSGYDDGMYTGTRVPRFYEPPVEPGMPQRVPEDWTAEDFNVYFIESGKHRHILDRGPERTEYILNPKYFNPQNHNRMLAIRKKQYKEGLITFKQMQRACHDDKIFMEAVKSIMQGGLVHVPIKKQIFYPIYMSRSQVKELYDRGTVPKLDMSSAPDYKWTFG